MVATRLKRTPAEGPAWLDQVLGCSSPPFSFRNGGSAITGGTADKGAAQKTASIKETPRKASGAKNSQLG